MLCAGVKEESGSGIDAFSPVSKDEFEQFQSMITEKVTKYHVSIDKLCYSTMKLNLCTLQCLYFVVEFCTLCWIS